MGLSVHAVVVRIDPLRIQRVATLSVQLGSEAGSRAVELIKDSAENGMYKGEFTIEDPAKTPLLGVVVWALPVEEERIDEEEDSTV